MKYESNFQRFCSHSVNLAMDYTLEFDWIYKESSKLQNGTEKLDNYLMQKNLSECLNTNL